jgi:hypothetical protein
MLSHSLLLAIAFSAFAAAMIELVWPVSAAALLKAIDALSVSKESKKDFAPKIGKPNPIRAMLSFVLMTASLYFVSAVPLSLGTLMAVIFVHGIVVTYNVFQNSVR